MPLLLSLLLAAQAPSEPVPEPLAIFASLELPNCGDAKFVELAVPQWETRDRPWFMATGYIVGWLVSGGSRGCSVLDEDLQLRTLTPRQDPVPAAIWRQGSRAAEIPAILELDFVQWCREAMAEPTGAGAHPVPVPELRPAVLAWWAHQRREFELRDEILRTRPRPVSTAKLLTTLLVHNARQAANQGQQRSEILRTWRNVERIGTYGARDAAARMVAAYEMLLAEDSVFAPLTAADLAELPPPAQAEAWLHQLRDVDLRISNPFPSPAISWEAQHPTTRALCELGWDAIPGLIRHLDDERPTRTLEWRRFQRGCHLLTHADWSRELLEVITGRRFETRAAADGWWEKRPARERFCLDRLAVDGSTRVYAARQLLALDAVAHLPPIVGLIRAAECEQRAGLVRALAAHATHAHVTILESLLPELDEPATSLTLAQGLARLGAPMRGVERMAELVLAATATGALDPSLLFDTGDWIDAAVAFVRAHDRRRAEQLVLALLDAASARVRLRGFAASRQVPTPAVLAELVRQLDDPMPTGWALHYEIRTCDAAADALSAALDVGIRFRLDPVERNRNIAALREHWIAVGRRR